MMLRQCTLGMLALGAMLWGAQAASAASTCVRGNCGRQQAGFSSRAGYGKSGVRARSYSYQASPGQRYAKNIQPRSSRSYGTVGKTARTQGSVYYAPQFRRDTQGYSRGGGYGYGHGPGRPWSLPTGPIGYWGMGAP